MFKWLERRAAKQSLFNVRINAQTLIAVSNRADAAIGRTATTNPSDIKAVASAQRSLLTDIQLALANGASLSDVEQKIAEAKSKEQIVSAGAEKALAHVLGYVSTSPENRKKATEREEIVAAYGAYLEGNPTSGLEVRDVCVLPYSKEAILDAICLEIVRTNDSKRREALKVSAIFLADFQEGVGEKPLHKSGVDFSTINSAAMTSDQLRALASQMAVAAEGKEAKRYQEFATLASQELQGIQVRLVAAEKIGQEMPEAKKRESLDEFLGSRVSGRQQRNSSN